MIHDERKGCSAVGGRLAAYVRDELPPREARAVAEHLRRCAPCRARASFERRLATRLRELGPVTVPPRLERRIQQVLHGTRRAG